MTRPLLWRTRIVLHACVIAVAAWVFLPGPLEALLADYESDVDEPLPPRALAHYRAMKAHFEEPFEGYGATEVFTPAFSIVMLSHAAAGTLNVGLASPSHRGDAARVLDEIARRAVSREVSPYRRDPRRVRDLGDHNLYLSHLALVLNARGMLTGDDAYDALDERIVTHLARRSLASGSAHAHSFPGSARFPADQAVVLAALHLHDVRRGTQRARRPTELWLRAMRREVDPATGLHRSSITPSYPHGRLPRGCALSWTALYMAQFAPDEAAELYARYRSQYHLSVLGWGSFREYPPGADGRMDVDSGPIVFDMGVAATGIGLGAARMFGDREGYASILRTASSVGLPTVLSSSRTHRLSPLLGDAILLHGMTARRWSGEPPPRVRGDEAPFPIGSLFMVLLIALVIAWSARSFFRLTRRRALPDHEDLDRSAVHSP